MLERFLKLRGDINEIINRHVTAPPTITALEAQQIEEIVNLLRPFEAATKELCGEKYVTASKIIPIMFCLTSNINTSNCQQEIATELKVALIKELKKRFGQIEEVRLLALSTLLDPRFKKVNFENPLACSKAVAALNSFVEESISAVEQARVPDETQEAKGKS